MSYARRAKQGCWQDGGDSGTDHRELLDPGLVDAVPGPLRRGLLGTEMWIWPAFDFFIRLAQVNHLVKEGRFIGQELTIYPIYDIIKH